MAAQIIQSSEQSQIKQVIQESGANRAYNTVYQESVVRGDLQHQDQPYTQIYAAGGKQQQQQDINYSSEVKNNQQYNMKTLNSSISRKVIHYENPRKYVEYSSPLQYDTQNINYTNKIHTCQQTCSCNSVQISLNPSYRFKVTREIDLKQSKVDQDNEYEQLLLKVQNLEAQHYQEINKLKEEYNIERLNYEKEASRHQLELLKTVYVEKQEIAKPVREREIIQEQNIQQVDKYLIQIEQQSLQIKQLEEKVASLKIKKKTLSEENQQIKNTLFEKDLSIKQYELQLQQKLQFNNASNTNNNNSNTNNTNNNQNNVSSVNNANINQVQSNLSEIESQNQFLIQELGRITEEYEQLKKNGNVIEKLVYVPSVQNVTTVKEVPPYIEEKIIYIQDTDQLEACQKIISQLQQEILLLNQEKQKLVLSHAEEKTQLMERITNITKLQKSDQANIIKEVVVQKVIDRTEIQLKEQELQESYKKLQEYSLKIAELEQIVQTMQLEIQRLTKSYKIVKLPNNYKIQQTQEIETVSYQTSIIKQNNLFQSSARQQLNLETQKQLYASDQTIKRNMGYYQVESVNNQEQQELDIQKIQEQQQQEIDAQHIQENEQQSQVQE